MIATMLAFIMALLLNPTGCPAREIVQIASDYQERYIDATNGEPWELLFEDLQSELDQCRRRNKGEQAWSGSAFSFWLYTEAQLYLPKISS